MFSDVNEQADHSSWNSLAAHVARIGVSSWAYSSNCILRTRQSLLHLFHKFVARRARGSFCTKICELGLSEFTIFEIRRETVQASGDVRELESERRNSRNRSPNVFDRNCGEILANLLECEQYGFENRINVEADASEPRFGHEA